MTPVLERPLCQRDERELRAVEAGWEPFEPAAEWHRGLVEDPRFLHGHVQGASVIAALAIGAALGAIIGSSEAMAGAAVAIVSAAGAQVAVRETLGRISAHRDDEHALVFNAPIPAEAVLAYRKAKASELFDSIVVCAPDPAMFREACRQEAPNLGLLDPVLVGYVGDQGFLIAQWDLSRDLAKGSYSKKAPGMPTGSMWWLSRESPGIGLPSGLMRARGAPAISAPTRIMTRFSPPVLSKR